MSWLAIVHCFSWRCYKRISGTLDYKHSLIFHRKYRAIEVRERAWKSPPCRKVTCFISAWHLTLFTYPRSLYALKDWWFLSGQTTEKNLSIQEIAIEFVLRTLCLNYSRVKFWVEGIIVTLFGCRSDRRYPHSKQLRPKTCRNSNYKFCTTKIVVLFWQNKQSRPGLLVLVNLIACLRAEILRGIAFIPLIPKRV